MDWCLLLGLNLETAAAMEITRQSYYRKGWENAMAIRGICEPLEEAHAQRILSL